MDYRHFTAEVQFDETGSAVIIDIETANSSGATLRLDIEELVRERITLLRMLGALYRRAVAIGGVRLANLGHRLEKLRHNNREVCLPLMAGDELTDDYLAGGRGGGCPAHRRGLQQRERLA